MQPKPLLFKVLLLGNTGVGKSSLFHHYAKREFIKSIVTYGLEYAAIDLKVAGDQPCKLQIWDCFNGPERFTYIRPDIFKGTSAIVLVYDVTRRDSLDVLSSWIDDIHKHLPRTIPLFVVANKVDLQADRVVSPEEGQKAAIALGAMGYWETSVKSGQNLDAAIQSIGEQVFASHDKIVTNPVFSQVERKTIQPIAEQSNPTIQTPNGSEFQTHDSIEVEKLSAGQQETDTSPKRWLLKTGDPKLDAIDYVSEADFEELDQSHNAQLESKNKSHNFDEKLLSLLEVFQKKYNDKYISSGRVKGCSLAEIHELESSLPSPLPQFYVHFLRIFGKDSGNDIDTSIFGWQHLKKIREKAQLILEKSEDGFQLLEEDFVFFEGEGVFFAYFSVRDPSPDPYISYYDPRFQPPYYPRKMRMSDFFIQYFTANR